NTRFDSNSVKKQIGIAPSQSAALLYSMPTLAERKVPWNEARGFFMSALCETPQTGSRQKVLPNERALRSVQ
ncbi:DUF932 domain-containing protein, partial [Pseudomonas aeruginosa]